MTATITLGWTASELKDLRAIASDTTLTPRNVFGEEADTWPTVRVCGECHAHWHRRMDGYRITAPRVRHG